MEFNIIYAMCIEVSLENYFVLNKRQLLDAGRGRGGGLGYDINNLACISKVLVPYDGLRNVQPIGRRDSHRLFGDMDGWWCHGVGRSCNGS